MALILALALPLRAATIVWCGGAGGTNWNAAANWTGRRPAAGDEAVLTGSTLVPGQVIALETNQAVAKLTFGSTTPIVVGSSADAAANNTLTVGDVSFPASWSTAVTCTWTGGSTGTGTSWNVGANWDGGSVPDINDTALFTAAGLTNNKTIALGASQTVFGVTFATTNTFTIGAPSDTNGVTNALVVCQVSRQHVAGTDGTHTLAAPVLLATNTTWTIDGSNALHAAGGIAGGFGLTKLGTGTLRLSATTYTGDTVVASGALVAMADGAIKGNLIVGTTNGTAASYNKSYTTAGSYDNLANSRSVTVYSNSSCALYNAEHIMNLYVYGGTASAAGSYIDGSITMSGGTLSGNIYGNHSAIASLSNAATAQVSAYNGSYIQYAAATFSVADGPAPIDLECAGAIANGTAANTLTKSGAGTLLLSAPGGNTYSASSTIIASGTLLLANTNSGSATGPGPVTVSAGATLGGTGYVGGAVSASNANVTLSSGVSTNSMATLAPGMVDRTTGAHLIGTLSIGRATVQTNNVSFGKFSRLAVQLGPTTARCDRLDVSGCLNLGGPANTNVMDLATGGSMPRAGDYTVATFGVLTGRFTFVRIAAGARLPPRVAVSYQGTPSGALLLNGSVVVTVPPPACLILVQ